ncbi:hypothetical protein CkaCkLH20_04966 [Colletotrichum karsti]|uniref:Uncharacterized protein n=1 Tax=Colletotrichum karsti TaxID=1095194 RepID=A0A9P6LM48_9PEZI|nr:uncharacterized protein CkaCkLH20_04966 [Colletotrichum karsti]KAF9877831.1 hypothetical protein CkaCkLH20_04966 [Colletotrichum karsti]
MYRYLLSSLVLLATTPPSICQRTFDRQYTNFDVFPNESHPLAYFTRHDVPAGKDHQAFRVTETSLQTPAYEYSRWGFYIYRTTYDDDDLWDRYVTYIHEKAKRAIDLGSDGSQGQFRVFLVEGPGLDGTSIEDVREQYLHWSSKLSISDWEISPWWHRDLVLGSYPLYVDAECLESLRYHEGLEEGSKERRMHEVFIKAINAEQPRIYNIIECDDGYVDESGRSLDDEIIQFHHFLMDAVDWVDGIEIPTEDDDVEDVFEDDAQEEPMDGEVQDFAYDPDEDPKYEERERFPCFCVKDESGRWKYADKKISQYNWMLVSCRELVWYRDVMTEKYGDWDQQYVLFRYPEKRPWMTGYSCACDHE